MGHKGSKAGPISIDDIPANLDWAVSEAGIHEARLLDEKELLQADITKSQSEDNERKLTSTWQKHRANLYTKYIFVRDSLETLITAAVAAGRVRGHIRYLDRVIGLEDVASRKTMLEDRRAKYVQQCQLMCTDWDKSYYAVEWLIRDYDLAIRYRWLDNAINGVSAGGVPAPVAEGKVAPTSAANNVNFADRDKFIKKRDKLVKEMQIHENEALDIGLNFLDTRHQGGVEARDLPDMDPELWMALDNRKKGKITPKELHSGMQTTMKERDRAYDDVVNKYNNYNEIKGKLDAHNREYAMTNTDAKVIQKRDSYQTDLNAAEAEYRNSVRIYEEKKALVDRLYQYFMTAFIKNALTPLDRPQSDMADDIQTTFQKLKVEQQRVDQLPATVSH